MGEAADAAGLVTREQLEASLERIVPLAPADERAGIYGPESVSWRVNRESMVFLGAGRAALLQLADPYVAYGVEHHSATRTDPFGRFRRTFYNVFAMVFGDRETAFRAARMVHAIHSRIEGDLPEEARGAGTRYRANEPEALFWVHATLLDTAVMVFEKVVRRLKPREKARYYEESRRFAYLFGIPDDVIPPDWDAFQDYMARMFESPRITVTTPAREMARFLLAPMHPALGPLMDSYKIVTARLLPERIAEGFGLSRGGAPGRAIHEAALRSASLLRRGLPARLRYGPAYIEAKRRLAGRTDRDRVGEFLTQLLVGKTHTGTSARAG